MEFEFFKTEEKLFQTKAGNSASYTIVTINAPGLNALSSKLFAEFEKLLAELESTQCRVAIFTGTGKAFVAGADISEMKDMTPKEAFEYSSLGHRLFSRLESASTVFIAAVNGFAFGGGLEFAMACDIRIFSDNALCGLPEPTLALIPGFGGTQRLPQLIGYSNARHLALTADRINAHEALRVGLCSKVVPAETLLDHASEIAQKILVSGPNAIRTLKSVMKKGAETDFQSALKLEAEQFSTLFSQAESREGLTAFLEKRPAKF